VGGRNHGRLRTPVVSALSLSWGSAVSRLSHFTQNARIAAEARHIAQGSVPPKRGPTKCLRVKGRCEAASEDSGWCHGWPCLARARQQAPRHQYGPAFSAVVGCCLVFLGCRILLGAGIDAEGPPILIRRFVGVTVAPDCGRLGSLRRQRPGTHPAVVRSAIVHTLDVPTSAFGRVDIPPLTLTDLRYNGKVWTVHSSDGACVNLIGIRPQAKARSGSSRFRTSTFDSRSGSEAEFRISMPTSWHRLRATLTTVEASF
jgi:hypothetical protein